MTTPLQTLTSRLKGDRPRAGFAAGAQRRAVRRSAATRRGFSSDAINSTGVAGFGPLSQTLPPRTR